MDQWLFLVSVVLLLCVVTSKLLYRFGVPTLLIFMALGMLFGSEGPGGIQFDNYELTRDICSVALIFIIFYGGFGTSWKLARPVAAQAILMASVGVIITAGLTGIFFSLVFGATLLEGLLIGSVVASTDAASVFAILRSRALNLKGGLASLLEVESGSNDPIAYMLTIIVLSLMQQNSETNLAVMVLQQVGLGLAIGAVLAWLTVKLLQRFELEIEGLYSILMIGVALFGYELSNYGGGNGYLCVYVCGIILGNSRIPRKMMLVPFLDAVSWTMQIALFFTLGLLAVPSRLPEMILPGLAVFLFMLLVARPAATFSIMSWFRAYIRPQFFVSWVGLRGAASIVFAIYAATARPDLGMDIYHLVFMVCLLSIIVQGTFLPQIARRLRLIDNSQSVFQSFTDYDEFATTELVELVISPKNPFIGTALLDMEMPDGTLPVMLKRGRKTIIPNKTTVLKAGDRVVLSTRDRTRLEKEANAVRRRYRTKGIIK